MTRLLLRFSSLIVSVIVSAALLISCSAEDRAQISSLGSQMLGKAGISVSSSQMNSLLDAGDQIAKASRGFSPEQEYFIGRGVAAKILGKYRPLKNPSLNAYVNKVGRVLSANSSRPELYDGYHFGVLDSEEVNALSAPAGFIFITKGFLQTIPNEDALAAVLAHEVSHVVLGHGTAAISQSNVTSTLALVGKQVADREGNSVVQQLNGYFGDSVSEVAETLMIKGYSRSQEYEADTMAVELLNRSGYSSSGMNTMLTSLKSLANQSGGWFGTHPPPDKRLNNLADPKNTSVTHGFDLRAKRYVAATKGL